MTEKRFKMIITSADGSFYYLDEITGEKITSTLELENKLNELHDENQKLKKENEQLKQFQNKVAEVIESKMGDNVCNDYKMEVLKEVWNELELDRVWFE